MLEFGDYLKKAREDRGLTVEKLADLTKVRPGLLKSLEEGRFDLLPEKVFVRGYVQAYVAAVELDAREAMDGFELAWGCARGASEKTCRPAPTVPAAVAAFKPVYLLLVVIAILTFSVAWAVQKSGSPKTSHKMSSIQQTDVDSGTTRSLSDFKGGRE